MLYKLTTHGHSLGSEFWPPTILSWSWYPFLAPQEPVSTIAAGVCTASVVVGRVGYVGGLLGLGGLGAGAIVGGQGWLTGGWVGSGGGQFGGGVVGFEGLVGFGLGFLVVKGFLVVVEVGSVMAG